MISNIKECWQHIPYTLKHKIAYLQVEKELTGKISLEGLLHDTDKLIMYALLPHKGVKAINKFHRATVRHHVGYIIDRDVDWEAAVIDWECARITKPDKPLNARETMNNYYYNHREYIEPVLRKFGL